MSEIPFRVPGETPEQRTLRLMRTDSDLLDSLTEQNCYSMGVDWDTLTADLKQYYRDLTLQEAEAFLALPQEEQDRLNAEALAKTIAANTEAFDLLNNDPGILEARRVIEQALAG